MEGAAGALGVDFLGRAVGGTFSRYRTQQPGRRGRFKRFRSSDGALVSTVGRDSVTARRPTPASPSVLVKRFGQQNLRSRLAKRAIAEMAAMRRQRLPSV